MVRFYPQQAYKYDRTWIAKLCVRITLLFIVIGALGCVNYAVQSAPPALNGIGEPFGAGGDHATADDIWAVIPLSLALSWGTFTISFLMTRSRPVHPAFPVAFDLLIALGMTVASVQVMSNGVYNYQEASYDGFTNGEGCESEEACVQQVQATVSQVELAGGILTVFAAILEALLFAWACFDTHRRRRVLRFGSPKRYSNPRSRDDASFSTVPLYYNPGWYAKPYEPPVPVQEAPTVYNVNYSSEPCPYSPSQYTQGKRMGTHTELDSKRLSTHPALRLELDNNEKPRFPRSSVEMRRLDEIQGRAGGTPIQRMEQRPFEDSDSPISPI